MLVHKILEQSVDNQPDKLAVIQGPVRATFRDVEELSNRLANVLIVQGISRTDRVAILLENSLYYIAAYYGVLKTGAIVVPLFPSIVQTELIYSLNSCEAKAIITSDRSTELLEKSLPELKNLTIVIHKGQKRPKGLASQKILGWD